MKIGEFFVKLGIKVDQAPLQNFKKTIADVGRSLSAVKTQVIGVAAAYLYLGNQVTDATIDLKNFNQQTGLSITKLQRFQRVAELGQTGLDAFQVQNDITQLQKNLTDMKFGGGNTSAFRLLGIDATGKDAFQVIDEMRGAIKGLDDVTATNIIQRAGFSPEFLSILKLSNEEFQKMGKGSFLSEKQRKQSLQFGKALSLIKIEAKELKDQLIVGLMPIATNLMKMFTSISTALLDLTKNINKSKVGFASLRLLAVGLAFAFAPVYASIAALLLILEDLYVMSQGGDSAIGYLLNLLDKSFPDWSAPFKAMAEFARDAADALIEIAAITWVDLLEPFIGQLEEMWNWVSKLDGAALWDIIKGMGMSIQEKASSIFSGDTEAAKNGEQNDNSQKTTSVQMNNNYNINSTADGQSLATDITKGQARNLNNTFYELGAIA